MTGCDPGPGAPFLTVVIPAGIVGTQALRESLLSLVGQDDDDFEVILAVEPAADPEVLAGIEEAVADQPPRLTTRARLVEGVEGTPGSARNAASAAARGRYLTVLPEGDLALGRWVRTYHEGEPSADGRILRALGVTQDHTLIDVAGHRAVRAGAAPGAGSPAHFSLWQHALRPCSPAASWAWPRNLVDDHGTAYDAGVVDDPDWEFLVRTAQLVGVVDLGVVTSLSRRWGHAVAPASQVRDGSTAQDVIDSRALLIAPGESKRLRDGLAEDATDPGPAEELARTAEELRLTHDHAANLEAIVRNLEGQLAGAEERHAEDVARLRRKLERARKTAPAAQPTTTTPPSGRPWRGRRGSKDPAG